ncbi:MAG: hypothetical protein IKU29_10035 [Parabacteroides sp.]|nr:hypothetical protein [Parabacteroides sp.]
MGHNLRVPEIIAIENEKWAKKHPGELRIDPNGEHEVWLHQPLSEAYEHLFGKAIKEYNEKQIKHGTPDRCIDNYLQHIKAKEGTDKKAKHAVYEVIFSVGSTDDRLPEDVNKAILKEMVEEFKKQNPHMYVTSIAFHNDERGVMHVHLGYIPWCDDLQRGPRVQNGLKSALRQQGFVGTNRHDTAQMQWQRSMNDTLESICNKYGYQVDHYQRNKNVQHLSVEEYSLQKSIEEKQQELQQLQNLPIGKTVANKAYIEQLEETARKYREEKPLIDQAKRDINAANKEFEAYSVALQNLEQREADFDAAVNEAAIKKLDSIKDGAITFIKESGLFSTFKSWLSSIQSSLANKQRQQQQH